MSEKEEKTLKWLEDLCKPCIDEVAEANLQISTEPELASLREKSSEEDLEKAKELRGTILELAEKDKRKKANK